MASKALVLLGLFAVLLVVSEVAAASSATVNSESKETVKPDQRGYVTAATAAATEVTTAAQDAARMPEKLFRLSPVTKTIY
ncbi:unnamed protein product [Arabidopsis thaliana]|uniref:(thale cress) hypothetical protein n=1 Tax=Arabidopsis thaliana TaxID=3702 RepID=A0A7G2E955_ARATH|nr:unnamed protein product [Arabidopsis thaliana]